MKVLALLLLASVCLASNGDGIPGCTGTQSTFPLIDTPPTLVQTVANGKKFTIGIANIIQTTTVVNST